MLISPRCRGEPAGPPWLYQSTPMQAREYVERQKIEGQYLEPVKSLQHQHQNEEKATYPFDITGLLELAFNQLPHLRVLFPSI